MKSEKRLTKEKSFFLQVLSDYINGCQTVMPEDIDVSFLAGLSNAQQLAPIVYYQTKLAELEPSYAAAPYYNVNRDRFLKQISERFQNAGVSCLIFKGSEIARYYRHPQLRVSGDIDLLVRQSDKEKAGTIFEETGFRLSGNRGTDHEWVYIKGEFEIELHHRLLYDDQLNNTRLTAFTDTVWEHASATDSAFCCMEPEFHFVYLLLHLRKHFLWTGVGVRQFLDLAMMMKNAEMDYGKIEKYINACGIMDFTKVCSAFTERWFGVLCPLGTAVISDDFYSASTEIILSGGAFGDMSRKRLVDNAVMQENRRHGRIASTLSVILPPWEQMKNKYPGMSRWKVLLPVLWLRRIIESLFKRTAKDGMTYAGKHLTIGRQEKERDEMLGAWGLKTSHHTDQQGMTDPAVRT